MAGLNPIKSVLFFRVPSEWLDFIGLGRAWTMFALSLLNISAKCVILKSIYTRSDVFFMKKVGIITLYGNTNIGNKLQNYAVGKILTEQGASPCTIVYYPSDKQGDAKAGVKLFLKKLLEKSGLCYTDFYLKKVKKNPRLALIKKFDTDYIPTTMKYLFKAEKMHKYESDFDYYCAGSDQVWNPAYVQNNGFCFMRFTRPEKAFAFAASMGTTYIPDEYRENFKEGFNHVGNIAVREQDIKELISDMTDRESIVVSDPTLLLDQSDWKKLATKPDFEFSDRYIATYFLSGTTPQQKEFINSYAKQNSLEVVELNGANADKIGPAEFLYLLANAQFVFTDSFHGTAFSLIFRKRFMVFQRNNTYDMSSRIVTVLSTFKMEECFINTDNTKIDESYMDYVNQTNAKDISHIDEVMKSEKQKAIDFLNKVFED